MSTRASVATLEPARSLPERFWSLARIAAVPRGAAPPEPREVVKRVLSILGALDQGAVGDGLSVATMSFITLLRQAEVSGDLSYASPEQARGENVDERSLVFSVGVLLFEELTGRHPFGAPASGRRLARMQRGELGSGVQYFPVLPPGLRSVLVKAMGPFPEERYVSLAELREDLEQFLAETEDPFVAAEEAAQGARPVARVDDDTTRPFRPSLHALPPGSPQVMLYDPKVDDATQVRRRPARKPASAPQPTAAPQPAAAPPPATGRKAIERVVFTTLGAALALGGMLIGSAVRNGNGVGAAMIAATPHAAPPVVQPLPPKPAAAPPTAAAAPPTAAAEPTAAEPAAAADPSATAEPTTAAFDLQTAAHNAAKEARACFTPLTHTVSFGVGLLFSPKAATARRLFLSPSEPLTPDERRCLNDALLKTSASAPPPKSTILELRLRLRPGDGTTDEARISR